MTAPGGAHVGESLETVGDTMVDLLLITLLMDMMSSSWIREL
jgi:hypothetical protein